jgi:2-polyprenyl-6-methoxyphenol hydroxylase-like FAD-dependent oxidoreductase
MYDAIIVGARCAGSTLAMLLARRNYRVLLVDRATFPSDTLSGHYIQPAGMATLKRWGLFDRVTATNAPLVYKNKFDLGAFALTGTPPAIDGVSAGYCPRRIVLDKILVDAAVEAGAELLESFSVQELLWERNRVVGLRGRTRNGSIVAERARIVVGADGMNSFIARAVKAETYREIPALTFGYYTYWCEVQAHGVEIYPRDGRFIIALPTNDDLTEIAVVGRSDEFQQFRSDIEGNYLRALDGFTPELAARVRAGRRAERFMGTAAMENFFRKPHGAGWALVGDAGYHKDPITAQGMTDAFRDAEFLADALDDGFTGIRALDEALSEYERKRNEAVMPMYEMTCGLAALQAPSPEMQMLFRALRDNQHQTNRFFGMMAGSVPIPEFYEGLENAPTACSEISTLPVAAIYNASQDLRCCQ